MQPVQARSLPDYQCCCYSSRVATSIHPAPKLSSLEDASNPVNALTALASRKVADKLVVRCQALHIERTGETRD